MSNKNLQKFFPKFLNGDYDSVFDRLPGEFFDDAVKRMFPYASDQVGDTQMTRSYKENVQESML